MHFLVLLLLTATATVTSSPRCGGILTAARGVLQTPNFPHTLPVPISCEWVIDAQNLGAGGGGGGNTSIVVYLTQLYVNEGLSFTEYQIYDKSYQLDGRLIHIVNETNVVQVRWVQSFQNFLVITLKIDSGADSAHLRVYDHFLDVYGFNITYEITKGTVRGNSCNMMDCGFTGICYDHYTKFSCECFPGYSGPHCSSGVNSFCESGAHATCKNGGTCVHVGVSAVRCHCQPEFTGETCQISVSSIKTSSCENCVLTCSYDGKLDNACQCKTTSNKHAAAEPQIRFSCTMHLGNFPILNGILLKSFIQNQISKVLKTNYSKFEDVTVENVVYFRSGADVTFHLSTLKKDEKKFKAIFAKWADRGYIGNLTVADKEFVFSPVVDLQGVSINQFGVIRPGDEFILSCVARGLPSMTFRWFKDGVFINVSQTSHKWSRLIKDPHMADQYTALLGVESAEILDSGTFTCQVEDFHIQQCLSRTVFIKAPPIVKVEPMTLTIRKGENVTIKCTSKGDTNTKYTYSWTKNKELLPVRTETAKYEILYPSGSILQIFKVEKSVKYSCLVQDDAISTEKVVEIHVVDPFLIRTCPENNTLNITWPETAPDTDSLLECPKGYIFPGFVRRSCVLNDGLRPIWLLPDYSRCTSTQLYKILVNMEMLKLGYETANAHQIVESSLRYLNERRFESDGLLLPGEGTRILLFVRDVISYSKQSRYIPYDVPTALFKLVDRLLMLTNSLINQEQVKLLQEVVAEQIEISSMLHPIFHLALPSLQVNITSTAKTDQNELDITLENDLSYQSSNWIPSKLTIKEKSTTNKLNQFVAATVLYRNLTTFLPSRSVIRLRDSTELEYELVSQIIRLWIFRKNATTTGTNPKPEIIIEWINHLQRNSTSTPWFIKCAVAETALYAYSWNITVCETIIPKFNLTQCVCPMAATYALLLTKNNIQAKQEDELPAKYIVLGGCSLCFAASLTCSLILSAYWVLKKSCIVFLKLQCSVSIAALMITFVIGTISEPPKHMFAVIVAFTETFFLMAMSAHISILLAVYTELIQLPKKTSPKQTIIGISTGVPIITIFGNHLAHRTMEVKSLYWWLLVGSLAFHIFIAVAIVIIFLFLALHVIVINKLRKMIANHEKQEKVLEKRVRLLKKSSGIFGTLILVAITSIFYVNCPGLVWSHYCFSGFSVLLGILLIICYILKSDFEFYYLFRERFSRKQKENFFAVESTESPLNFYTKEDAEVESESIPTRKSLSPSTKSSIECFPMIESVASGKSSLPGCVTGALESSYIHTDGIYCAQSTIELYNRSPQMYRKNTQSPDIISSKVCTELDLIASHAPSIIITPEETKVTGPETSVSNSASVSKASVNFSSTNNAISSTSANIVTSTASDKLDGMLDRISHDLNYLLNSDNPLDVELHNRRKLSKIKTSCLSENVLEEEEDEEEEEAECKIMRTNC